jgi:DeoR family fructose operon transcriptional repressor
MSDQVSRSTDERPLLQDRRQAEILRLARETGSVEVAALSDAFGVTTETIRRDLEELQSRRMLRRVHGGAVLGGSGQYEPLLAVRGDQHVEEKRRIASAAIEQVPAGGTIIIDSGTTLGRFAEYIPRDMELDVITNSLPTAQILSNAERIQVKLLGGKVKRETLAVVDASAVDAIRKYSVDTAFISCDGMSLRRGLSTPFGDEASLKRAIITSAHRVVCLADSSKFGNEEVEHFADWVELDLLITDTGFPTAVATELISRGTRVQRV